MSTNTELVDELYASDAASALTNRAGRAIEAFEAEVERLSAYNKRLEGYNNRLIEQRDALQTQLAAAQGQEPVGLLRDCFNLLESFSYENDEDSQSKAFFKAHINLDWFFYVKNLLERRIAAPIPQQPSVLIGEMLDNGVVWFNQNPHAWPLGTTYYAAAAPQPKDLSK